MKTQRTACSRIPTLARLRVVSVSVFACAASMTAIGVKSAPVSGLYRITAGTYSECCGFAGNEFVYPLPDERQEFIRFIVSPSKSSATLTFLAEDARSVFQVSPCFGFNPFPPVAFAFTEGRVESDRTIFQTAIPRAYVNYTVLHGDNVIRVDGTLNVTLPFCADAPTQFHHTNITATLVPGPRLTLLGFSEAGLARVRVQGQAGWTDVIESSTDLLNWRPVSTNVMDFSLCPICPFADFEDPEGKNSGSRFYRATEYK